MSTQGEVRKITTHTLLEMKRHGEPIAMLTAYDFSMAKIIDAAGMDGQAGGRQREAGAAGGFGQAPGLAGLGHQFLGVAAVETNSDAAPAMRSR